MATKKQILDELEGLIKATEWIMESGNFQGDQEAANVVYDQLARARKIHDKSTGKEQ